MPWERWKWCGATRASICPGPVCRSAARQSRDDRAGTRGPWTPSANSRGSPLATSAVRQRTTTWGTNGYTAGDSLPGMGYAQAAKAPLIGGRFYGHDGLDADLNPMTAASGVARGLGRLVAKDPSARREHVLVHRRLRRGGSRSRPDPPVSWIPQRGGCWNDPPSRSLGGRITADAAWGSDTPSARNGYATRSIAAGQAVSLQQTADHPRYSRQS